MGETKVCRTCGVEKDRASGFYSTKSGRDGFTAQCRDCIQAWQRAKRYGLPLPAPAPDLALPSLVLLVDLAKELGIEKSALLLDVKRQAFPTTKVVARQGQHTTAVTPEIADAIRLRRAELDRLALPRDTKVCSECGEEKPLGAFPPSFYRDGKAWTKPRCRPCHNAYVIRQEDAKRTTPRRQVPIVRLDPALGVEVKQCATCGIDKPLADFARGDSVRKRSAHCRPCERVKRGSTERTYYSPYFDSALGYEVKQCSRCHAAKPLSEFYKGAADCRDCRLARNKVSYHANPAKIKESSRRYRLENAGKNRAANARWRAANAAWLKRYQLENAHLARENARRRRALKKGAPEVEIIDRQALIERDNSTCYLCGDLLDAALAWPHPKSITLDHMVPLARGGAHTAANLRVACLHCNCRKHDKLLAELDWYSPLPGGEKRADNHLFQS